MRRPLTGPCLFVLLLASLANSGIAQPPKDEKKVEEKKVEEKKVEEKKVEEKKVEEKKVEEKKKVDEKKAPDAVAKLEELVKKLEGRIANFEKAQASLKKLEGRVAGLEKVQEAFKKLEPRLAKLEKLEDAFKKFEPRIAALEKLEGSLKKLEPKLAALEGVIKKLEPRVAKSEDAAKSVHNNLKKLQDANADLLKKMKAEVEAHKKDTKRAEDTAKVVLQDLKKLQDANADLVKKVQAEAEAHKKDLKRVEDTAKSVQTDLKKLQDANADLVKKAQAADKKREAEAAERKKDLKRVEETVRKQGERQALENAALRLQVAQVEQKLKQESAARTKVEAGIKALLEGAGSSKKDLARVEALVQKERAARKRDQARFEEWLKLPFVGAVYHPTRAGCAGEVIHCPSSSIAKVYPPALPPAPPEPKKKAEAAPAPTEVALVSLPRRARKPLPALKLEDWTADDAPLLFWSGYTLYWNEEHEEALVRLDAAVKLDADARSWYFKSLTETALGEERAARASLAKAAELHLGGKPRADLIGNVLERVQGDDRRRLARALDDERTKR